MPGHCSWATLDEVGEPEHTPPNLETRRTLGTGAGMNEIILVRKPQVTTTLGDNFSNPGPGAAPHRGVAA
jgi:hypothetical protein